MLQITNNNTFDMNDRYNGCDFSFPAGATVVLDEDAAKHIFGFGDSDKTPYLVRQGWMRNSSEFESGMKMLSGFTFASSDSPLPGTIIDQQDDVDEPIEQDGTGLTTAGGKKKASILDKLTGDA